MKRLLLLLSAFCLLPSAFAAGVPEITATITVTNTTGVSNGATITVNGSTRTWTNQVFTPASQILTTNTIAWVTTNLFRQLDLYSPPTAVDARTNGGNTNIFILVAPPGQSLTVSSSGGYFSVSYSTNYYTNGTPVLIPLEYYVNLTTRTNVASKLAEGIGIYATNPAPLATFLTGTLFTNPKETNVVVYQGTTNSALTVIATNLSDEARLFDIVDADGTDILYLRGGGLLFAGHFLNGPYLQFPSGTIYAAQVHAGVSHLQSGTFIVAQAGISLLDPTMFQVYSDTYSGTRPVALFRNGGATNIGLDLEINIANALGDNHNNIRGSIGITTNASNNLFYKYGSGQRDWGRILYHDTNGAYSGGVWSDGTNSLTESGGGKIKFTAGLGTNWLTVDENGWPQLFNHNLTAAATEGAESAAALLNMAVAQLTFPDLNPVSGVVSNYWTIGNVYTNGQQIFQAGLTATNPYLQNPVTVGAYDTNASLFFNPTNRGSWTEVFNTVATLANIHNTLQVPDYTTGIKLTAGPTASFYLDGINPGWSGRRLVIWNNTGQTITIVYESNIPGVGTTNRINTLTGADRTFTGDTVFYFRYDGSSSRWILEAPDNVTAAATNAVAFLNGSATNLQVYADSTTAVPLRINGFSVSRTNQLEIKLGGTNAFGVNSNGNLFMTPGATANAFMTSDANGVGTWTQPGLEPGWYGDGGDGAARFDGTTTILGHAPASGVYTLTRSIFCSGIEVTNGVVLKTAGYKVFCTGTLTNAGNIQNIGGAGTAGGATGSAGGGGTDSAATELGAGANGGGGGASSGMGGASGTAGNNSTPSMGSNGAQGGTGGTGDGAGASGGAGGTVTSKPLRALNHHFLSGITLITGGAGGGGGGGGDAVGGLAGGGGGGGGAGGGPIVIFSRIINNTGTITVAGGAGAAGGNASNANCGGGGGGAGGGGGWMFLAYDTITAGTLTAAGGAAGSGGTGNGTGQAGANGTNGTAGLILRYNGPTKSWQ